MPKKITYFLITYLLLIATNFALANFIAGKDYVLLNKPVATETKDKIEVKELFWYYCPHCFKSRYPTEQWAKTLPASVEFIRQPAIFSKRWEKAAFFYYVLEYLGETEALHKLLFNAIHIHKNLFLGDDDFINWLVDHDISYDKAKKARKSFSVHINVNKAKTKSIQYNINGVPAIVVNGKYWTDTRHAGNKLYEVLEFLIAKESSNK